jgi:hypothetical protein
MVPTALCESASSEDGETAGLFSAAGATAPACGSGDGACAAAWSAVLTLTNKITNRFVIQRTRAETRRPEIESSTFALRILIALIS